MNKTAQRSLPGYLWKNVSGAFIPSYRWIRQSFWGLLGFIALDLATRDWKLASLAVEPLDTKGGIITTFANGASVQASKLQITDPGFITLLFSDPVGRVPVYTLLILAIASAIIIYISPKLSGQHLFRKDISRSIQWIGALMLLHGLLAYCKAMAMNDVVSTITNGQYKAIPVFITQTFAQAYTGFVIIAAGQWFRQGVTIREEQDLTI